MHKDYLGDSVYAEMLNHGAIQLTTENGHGPSNTIVMEPEVLEALNRYVERIKTARQMNAQAQAIYDAGMQRVETKSEPPNQKFPCGSRVRIVDDLGPHMSHFPSGVGATVKYVYAHAFGGVDVKSYCLDVDGEGEISWYKEDQLRKEDV